MPAIFHFTLLVAGFLNSYKYSWALSCHIVKLLGNTLIPLGQRNFPHYWGKTILHILVSAPEWWGFLIWLLRTHNLLDCVDLFTLILWVGSFLSLREIPHTHVSSVLNGILQVNPLQVSGVSVLLSSLKCCPQAIAVLASRTPKCVNSTPETATFCLGFPLCIMPRNSLQPVSWGSQSTFDNLIFKKIFWIKKKNPP